MEQQGKRPAPTLERTGDRLGGCQTGGQRGDQASVGAHSVHKLLSCAGGGGELVGGCAWGGEEELGAGAKWRLGLLSVWARQAGKKATHSAARQPAAQHHPPTGEGLQQLGAAQGGGVVGQPIGDGLAAGAACGRAGGGGRRRQAWHGRPCQERPHVAKAGAVHRVMGCWALRLQAPAAAGNGAAAAAVLRAACMMHHPPTHPAQRRPPGCGRRWWCRRRRASR